MIVNMKLKHLAVASLLLIFSQPNLANAQTENLPSINGYKREMQKTFAEEVSGKKNIAQVSQTARMLALMEFMEPYSYSSFFDCVKKYPEWVDLPATKREQVVDTCGRAAKSAMVKLSGPAPASTVTSTGQTAQSPDLRLNEVLSRLKDIDQRISVIQESQRTLQDSILSRIRVQRTPASNSPTPQEEEFVD